MSDRHVLDSTLDAILQGDADAFLGIVRIYGPGLRAFLSSHLFQQDAVDDMAQETLIAAYRSLNNFQRNEDFGAWLRGIARNKLKRHFEQSNRRGNLLEEFRYQSSLILSAELEESAQGTQANHLQAMLECISRLPERLRRVIHANLEGCKSGSLAEELETTPGAVYQLQYRALQLLRTCVTKELSHGN
ncbi:MAG: sigma-70 family RNA polymerase sigma factor [Verrucomicrobiota bacterium]